MKLSKSEILMLKRIVEAGVAYGEDLTRRELRLVRRLERRGLVERTGKPDWMSDRVWELGLRSTRRYRAVVAMSIASSLFSLAAIAITLMRVLR